ncbi:MAG: DUF1844 domain-containing protein [Polyangiaceae bacterium]|nr:DUF1844 domain-containing protein [Polyangiaceae bacterium]
MSHASNEPEIDFGTFVLSLGTSALMHLGLGEDGEGNTLPPNLPLAKQTIDCLAMLEEKTKGNLSGEEERILTQLLYDLRLQYVSASKRPR